MALFRIGLDIQMRIKEGTQRELGDKYRSSPLLKIIAHAGNLGRKTDHEAHTATVKNNDG